MKSVRLINVEISDICMNFRFITILVQELCFSRVSGQITLPVETSSSMSSHFSKLSMTSALNNSFD